MNTNSSRWLQKVSELCPWVKHFQCFPPHIFEFDNHTVICFYFYLFMYGFPFKSDFLEIWKSQKAKKDTIKGFLWYGLYTKIWKVGNQNPLFFSHLKSKHTLIESFTFALLSVWLRNYSYTFPTLLLWVLSFLLFRLQHLPTLRGTIHLKQGTESLDTSCVMNLFRLP